MGEPNRSRLALVPEPINGDLDAREADRARGLARRLELIFRQQFHAGDRDDPIPTANRPGFAAPSLRLPFCIRMTMEQVLDVADDVDLRAHMIESSTNQNPSGAQILYKAGALRDAAFDLRRIAAHLEDDWDESNGSL